MHWGLVLEQDKVLPSVASIIAEEPLSGSWWGHSAAKDIFNALQLLQDLPDVLCVKLVAGKATFVLERLWPAVLAVGQAREGWQSEHLSQEDQSLLELVDRVGSLRLDELAGPSKPLRESARLLERRLLVHGGELHTESGAHTVVLQTWSEWLDQNQRKVDTIPVEAAKSILEEVTSALNSRFGAKALLPWQVSPKRVD